MLKKKSTVSGLEDSILKIHKHLILATQGEESSWALGKNCIQDVERHQDNLASSYV
jgi:hypothetical protein